MHLTVKSGHFYTTVFGTDSTVFDVIIWLMLKWFSEPGLGSYEHLYDLQLLLEKPSFSHRSKWLLIT